MKKLCVLLSVIILLSLTACSSQSSFDYISPETGIGKTNSSKQSDMEYITQAFSTAETADTLNISYENGTENIKKIIKNASLSLETYEVKEAYSKLLDYAKTCGGYEFSRNLNEVGDYISIEAVIKINPQSLDDLLGYAGECGDIRYSNVSSDDITTEYYDIEIRLENKRRNLEKYYEYLAAAKNVDEMIKLQNEIDRITAEIESYEGQLRLWNALIEESTVTLSIYQKNDPNNLEPVDWSSMTAEKMGALMLNGFKSVCNVILAILQWLVIILFSALPFIIIAVLLIFIFVKISKANKKKKLIISSKADAAAKPENGIIKDNPENNSEDKN